MAAKGLQVDHNTFSCSICLDYLKEPVTIPCGHSYCMSCVNTHWNGEVGKQSYSCPQCRQSFTQRPVLVKNTMLAVLMEGLKKSGPPAAPLAPSSAAHGDVFCDLCSGRKVKAVKSCLQCLVSYCKEHLQPHYDVAALKKHKLVEPTENLQENICSRHDEVMKMFCRTDQQCICYLCSVDQHKGHDTVTAAAERTEKQRELQAFQQDLLQRIKLKEKDMSSFQHQVKNSSRSAEAAVEHSDRSLKELLQLLETRMSEVKQQVRSQQEAEEKRVKELQDKVQQEITELRRKFTELDTLSHSEDHVHFLHQFAPLSKVSEASDSVNSSQTPPPFQDMVTATVSKLRTRLQETSVLNPPGAVHKPKVNPPKAGTLPIGPQVTGPSQQSSSEESQPPFLAHFKSTEELREYVQDLTWDPQSLHNNMTLVNCRQYFLVQNVGCSQDYSRNPAKFTHFPQVVSKQSLTGRCSWMVEATRYARAYTIAVAYKSIRRRGSSNDCCFGKNAKSWALKCDTYKCEFWHNNTCLRLPKGPGKVVVFLDVDAGILSFFYRMDIDLHHIHTVRTNFAEPLLAGLGLGQSDSFAWLCGPEFY